MTVDLISAKANRKWNGLNGGVVSVWCRMDPEVCACVCGSGPPDAPGARGGRHEEENIAFSVSPAITELEKP